MSIRKLRATIARAGYLNSEEKARLLAKANGLRAARVRSERNTGRATR